MRVVPTKVIGDAPIDKDSKPVTPGANPPGARQPRTMLLTSVVFLAVVALVGTLVLEADRSRTANRQAEAKVAAAHYADRITVHIDRSLSATYALAAMVRVANGEVVDFDRVAGVTLRFYPDVSSLQLAPSGIITHIVPMAGNEGALGHDLLRDEHRNKEAIVARNTGKLTLAGPFDLIQGGGAAVIGRLPIFLPDKGGRFWGFSTVVIRVAGLLEGARMSALSDEGYRYELWRIHPDTGERQVFAASSSTALRAPIVYAFPVPNGKWHLSVEPKAGWISWGWIAIEVASTLAAGAVFAWLVRSALKE